MKAVTAVAEFTIRLTEHQRLTLACNIGGIVATSRRDTLAKLVRVGLVLADTDGRGGVLTPSGKAVAAQAVAEPDRRAFRVGAAPEPVQPRPVQLTETQRATLATALDPLSGGSVFGHGRTVAVLAQLGLIEPVEGWYERSVSRRAGRLHATSRTWGVVGHHITDAGRRALAEASTVGKDTRSPRQAPAGESTQPEPAACGRCRRAFDPTDTRHDGHARSGNSPFCRSCVDRCHESTDAFHVCAICRTREGDTR
ncbi:MULTISPECIES: hypothetical protein [Streptomycetaceae]|uniref:hypothetical protein n=1 Tax=Streptomyces sp. SID5468 TaxID=2690295 RepID=UPI0012FFBB0B|nr:MULTISPECIES: hypothetical protein [Streptomycetaceae]MYS59286.1 hypothetical protein [Streptomyces sp. SID5468]